MEIAKPRRDLVMAVAPEFYENVLCSAGSEVTFQLALTFGLEGWLGRDGVVCACRARASGFGPAGVGGLPQESAV
jgi:hypothetical protein